MADHECTQQDRLNAIEKRINGNGDLGIEAKARLSYEYIQKATASKNGLLDWVFRCVIMIVLAYIATKVGLK